MDIKILVQNFIEQYGLISIFVIVMLEYANFPLPSEVVLPLVGMMVAKGDMNFTTALTASILAGIMGSITNYLIGLYFGKPIIKYLLNKYPKTKKSVKSSIRWFKKYDKLSLILARVIPVARTFISIPAGISKMNMSIFIVYSSIGISLWNSTLIYLGYVLGNNLDKIICIMKNYSIIIVLILVLFTGIYYIIRKHKIN